LEGQGASLSFKIDEGKKKYFGRTIVTGNIRTKYKVIDREMSKKEGLPYNYSLLAQERQKLYKLGLFTDIELKPLDEFDEKKDILVNLQEGDAGTVEFGFGYTDYERLRGFVDVSYRNLWGMNRQSSLRLELSTIEKRYIFQYHEPWFMHRPIPFRFFLLGEEKKEVDIDTREVRYRLTRHAATAGFEKKLTRTVKADLYYEFSVVRTYDVKPDVILTKEDTGTLIISGIRFGLIHDTRDNPFYPGKGILSGVSTKFTTPLLLSETDFVKVMFHFNAYHTLTKGIVLAASFRGGVAEGYGDTAELPIVERFFLGGRTSVRGYEQDTLGPKGNDDNPTGGNAFLMESIEVRTSITKSIGLVAFLDGGNVWQRASDINLSDFKFTTGLGLRYNTPVGPARVDYGHKLQREKGESAGEVHFSIGHAF
jgi:outer membrane protein insertion porin family